MRHLISFDGFSRSQCFLTSSGPAASRLARLVAVFASSVLAATTSIAQNDLTDIPEPNPAAEIQSMTPDPLAHVNLFAADPDISKPIQINFDASGGLWIASSEVYPQIEPGEKADDKIVVLRDNDGDGVAETRTVFADGLLIPTGILPDGEDAAYVAEGTQLLYLQDTDGDGRADTRRVVLSGFGTEDTHHLVHTLRWGPDGCVYFNQSIYIHSHIDTPDGTRHLDGGGIWRYHPSTGRLDVVCKGFINPWGHVFDPQGESFVTDGAYFEGINYAFPDAVFVTSPGATRWLKGMNPGSPKHCGLEILSGSHVPSQWRGDLVTSDFRSHRVCRFTVKTNASGYISRQQPEIITSKHIAFRPIDARMGPDGALYVADWYNPIIQHGEVDFRDERRDRKHGRIWRVSFPGQPLDPWPNFAEASVDGLLDLLDDDSLAVRQFARQQLWQRDHAEVLSAMHSRLSSAADPQKPQRVLELLWLANQASDTSEPWVGLAKSALEEPSLTNDETIRTVMRSIWRQLQTMPAENDDRRELTQAIIAKTTDPHPRARLEAIVCCGQLGTLQAAKQAIAATQLPLDDNLDDDNLDFALWQTLSTLQSQWIEASKRGELDWSGKESALTLAVNSVKSPQAASVILDRLSPEQLSQATSDELLVAAVGASDASQFGELLSRVMQVDAPERRAELLAMLLQRTQRDGLVPASADERLSAGIDSVDSLLKHEPLARAIASAVAAWKTPTLEPLLIEAIDAAPPTLQSEIVVAVGALQSPRAKATIDRLAASENMPLRLASIRSLVQSRPSSAIEPLVKTLQASPMNDSLLELVSQIVSRKELPGLLAQRLQNQSLPVDTARLVLRRVRSAGGNEALESSIRAAGKLEDAAWKLTPELTQRLIAQVKAEGSAAAGESIYRRANLQCIQCHAIGPGGGVVGPNLISLGGSSQLDYIIESLIDPSAKLKEGYTTLSVLTDEGKLVSGIIIGRDEKAVRLRLADGTETQIAAEAIEQEMPGKSLMPTGVLDELSEKELVDLVAFMSSLGREPAFTVATTPIVRYFETLVYSAEANRVLNRTSTDSVAADHPLMQWRGATSRVNGTIPLSELDRFQQHREVPPTSFIRFDVSLSEAGPLGVKIPGEGIDAWVDGKPTPIWNLESVQLERGAHRVILGIDRSKRIEDFVIKL